MMVSPFKLAKGAARFIGNGLSPVSNFESVCASGRAIYRHRELLVEMIKREMMSTHAGHGLGGIWIYVHPLVLVAVYLLFFGFILGSRIASSGSFPGDYSSYVLVGLVPWLMIQASISRSPMALTSNASLVKQVVFPIEILPVASCAAAIIPFAPAFVLIVLYKALVAGGLSWTFLLLPIALLLLFTIGVGLAFALASVTVFVRDVRELVSLFCLVAMYLTPAVYLPDWVPVALKPLLYLNPFSYLTWIFQDALFFGAILHPYAWLVTAVFALGSLGIGYRVFRKLKMYYGNAI